MRTLAVVTLMLLDVDALPTEGLATNGDNLIAIGPISRAMGGVGIAYPLDAISAVFANPAAMCFGLYCPSAEVNFAGTLFMPDVEAKITTGGRYQGRQRREDLRHPGHRVVGTHRCGAVQLAFRAGGLRRYRSGGRLPGTHLISPVITTSPNGGAAGLR